MEQQIEELLLVPYNNGSVSIATDDIHIRRICEWGIFTLVFPQKTHVLLWCSYSELPSRNPDDQQGAVQLAPHGCRQTRHPALPKEPPELRYSPLVGAAAGCRWRLSATPDL